ncbi:MAG: hypothetical protein A2X80_04035 [Geobacteraceae bacterium GWB2_52_12]|nr:MAG: hypothetical protein A2X80_04035 [Geobacteraceae bacterium GWB2_52_12]
MNKESTLLAVVALIVGLLGGYLIFSISNAGKARQVEPAIQSAAGSPTDYTQRIAQAEKIVAQDPKNLNAWISLGNDYFDTEQVQKSINAYGKALEIQPNNPNILTDQGVMYRKTGWYDKALANFEKANKIDPGHLQSLFNAGIVYMVDMKQPEKAYPYWERYLKLDSTSQTAIQIKELMQQSGKRPLPATK